jgi:hypothetical protein
MVETNVGMDRRDAIRDVINAYYYYNSDPIVPPRMDIPSKYHGFQYKLTLKSICIPTCPYPGRAYTMELQSIDGTPLNVCFDSSGNPSAQLGPAFRGGLDNQDSQEWYFIKSSEDLSDYFYIGKETLILFAFYMIYFNDNERDTLLYGNEFTGSIYLTFTIEYN